MIIRRATTGDVPDIYAVLASVGGSMPWQDEQECRHHIEWMLRLGALPVVVEEHGAVIAEMEMWWGPDVPELGTTLDVSMLNVRADRQRRGVGGGLLARALRLASEKGCNCCCVWGDRDAIGFYRKQGFSDRLAVRTFSLDPRPHSIPEGFTCEPVSLESLPEPDGRCMRTQRLLHPRLHWNVLVDAERNPPTWRGHGGAPAPPVAYRGRRAGHAEPFVAVFRPAYWTGDAGRAEFYLWSDVCDRPLLGAAMSLATRIGTTDLRTCAYGPTADILAGLGTEVCHRQTVLAKSADGRIAPATDN